MTDSSRYLKPSELLKLCIREEDTNRPAIWPGDTLLVHSKKGIGAKLIQFGTKSDYNHVATYVGDGMLVESDGMKGIQLKHLNWYIKHKEEQDLFRIARPIRVDSGNIDSRKYTKKDGKHTKKHALSYIGKGYDYIALAGFFFRFLGMAIPANPFDIKGRFFCSEFWKRHNADAEIYLVPEQRPEYTSPGDIARDSNIKYVGFKDLE
jgi:hypothetical protein